MSATEELIWKVQRQSEPRLEAHNNHPAPTLKTRRGVLVCVSRGGETSDKLVSSCFKPAISSECGLNATHSCQAGFLPACSCRVGPFLATYSFDVQNPSSSRAAASAEHNEMRCNVRVIASRKSCAQDQGKGSQSEDRMVGHHSSRSTATFATLPNH
jgi:hypothetical protein